MQCTVRFGFNAVTRNCLNMLYIYIALQPNHTYDKH